MCARTSNSELGSLPAWNPKYSSKTPSALGRLVVLGQCRSPQRLLPLPLPKYRTSPVPAACEVLVIARGFVVLFWLCLGEKRISSHLSVPP